MAQAYTPGLKVTNRITHRVRRILPIVGDVLVKVGDHVQADDVVAETFMPGDVTPVNLANLLSVPAGDVPGLMMKREGDKVQVGEPLAQTRGIFGFMKTVYRSKHAGTIETISGTTGQMILRGDPVPVQVRGYMAGEVVEVIPRQGCVVEAEVAFIQGIFGIGGETHGPIVMAGTSHTQELTDDLITEDMAGKIVVGGARVHDNALRKARDVGAAAIVTGGIDDHDLKEFLGYDLGVAITGNEEVGLSLIITEGFGDIAMAEATYTLLHGHKGDFASVNGATQIRAGVMRPEVIIPLTGDELQREAEPPHTEGLLEMGRPVRIIRDPYFGLIGEVAGLPTDPFVLGSGSRARVLEVKLNSGETVTVPRANVELIEV